MCGQSCHGGGPRLSSPRRPATQHLSSALRSIRGGPLFPESLVWTPMRSSMASPRTLTQMFREREAPRLVEHLLERPDLAIPDLTGFSQLASRATTRHSVGAAVDKLNDFELWVAG